MKYTATLTLEDGSSYRGTAFGAERPATGEVVFNTGMVGYPETLTDPSYNGQILVCTYPLIGNYGIPNGERENSLLRNFESEHIHVQGLIVTDYSHEYSHWSAARSLGDWLKEEDIPAVTGIDTRALTKKLREKGSMLGRLTFGESEEFGEVDDPNLRNLAAEVSCAEPVKYEKGPKRIAVIDCGVKNNIIQAFLRRDISVVRLPHDADFVSDEFDGAVVSNGPGDPKLATATIENTRRAMKAGMPILGICLGSQVLALASGADTYKLKYGHRSHNQPVNESGTRRCLITSQNHGY
ncbi:MAG: carbamoyl phosphate synthase small subunit, partial [Ectothiorhodospiraceae bacterium]|nr:carbamoyl phosphate synthase small subunit [Ectothiorhodospiraceae bacterium]